MSEHCFWKLFESFYDEKKVSADSESIHYENLPMQYTEIFSPVKIENFVRKSLIFFLFLLKT